jgi:hypothetical protein
LLAIIFAIIQEKCNNKNAFSDDHDRDRENGCVVFPCVYRLIFSYKMKNLLSFRAYYYAWHYAYCYAWHYAYCYAWHYAWHYAYCYAWHLFSHFYYVLHSCPYLRLLLMVRQMVLVLNLEKANFDFFVCRLTIGLLPFLLN